MLQGVHLVGEDEDDVYGGFNDYNPAFDTENLEEDEEFQQALKTSHGQRPGLKTGMKISTSAGRGKVPGSSMGRPTTGIADTGMARPMTAVRAVGYTSSEKTSMTGGAQFDPFNQARLPAPPLEGKAEESPEEKIKQMEKKVNELVEESCFANDRGEYPLALEKAKEAGRKERALCRQREQSSLGEQVNLDMTYSVLFNLANQYHANKLYAEALNTYQVIVKNKMFSNAGRLRVNMGNIYCEQKKYPQAVKQYRMALDQVPNTHKDMRIKIMQNIGVAFVKIGQFSDAVTSFEHIMGEKASFQTGFNLLLCYYALGDKEKMKKTFQKLLTVSLGFDDEDKYTLTGDDPQQALILEVIRNDRLRQIERQKKSQADKCIMSAAKLISPAIESSFAAGFDWCIECVKASPYLDLANELEITKAITYLKEKDLAKAIETLKGFEKKDSKVQSTAATNLSFLYFLENEVSQADKYAELAITADRYNPAALVNKGNCLFANGEYEKAREYYQEAYNVEASCTEALFNLGLAEKKLNRLGVALDCFYKLQAILKNHPQVLYQIASIHEMLEDKSQAIEWYMQLVSVVPTDPSVLSKLGELYDSEQDKSQAFQYHFESYRYFPSNIDIISWLGAYYIDSQFCEKAIHYFEKAAVIQPNEVKWQLMIASCYRRSGNYQQALETYKTIHKRFPENVECLKFLVRICTDLGLKDVQDYAQKLKKAEKAREMKQQRSNSGSRKGSGRAGSANMPGSGGSRNNSAGSESGRVDSGGSDRRRSANRSAGRTKPFIPDNDDSFSFSGSKEVDATYADPLGEAPARPKTAGRQRPQQVEDEFGDEEIGDDLLPD
ncbi:intraflagellar transport protein 88 homolog [Pocillopora verrucosa]|uniref:intraflagellar transport protein 88 homolog n=1 Tax=Pocillopora damicornis TaxID=46731 RepID=UPI000F54FA32|nr:intraflagellar transport protein 88 homolog [Pocillopora damicornis]XP_058953087.1 intraflagellar transport protein 88 homolog [Pocillopora verrucosa]